MSIKEITMYTVVCDRCGKSADEGTEYAGWNGKSEAEDVAMCAEYQIVYGIAGRHHYCFDCYQIEHSPAEEECKHHIPKDKP